MTITGGAGGLAASLDDMAGFDQAMRNHRLIGQACGPPNTLTGAPSLGQWS